MIAFCLSLLAWMSWREYFQEGPGAFADFVRVEGKSWKWTGKDLK
jgi:hypothetical protein